MRLEIGCDDHNRLRDGGLGRQPSHHSGEDPLVASPFLAILEGIRRTILLWRIAPPQAITVDEDYSAQDTSVIDARLAMALWKEVLEPLHLRVVQSEKVAHSSISLRRLNQDQSRQSMGPDPNQCRKDRCSHVDLPPPWIVIRREIGLKQRELSPIILRKAPCKGRNIS